MSTREQFVTSLKAQLDEWNAKIDELDAKSRKLQAKAGAEYQKKLKALKDKRDEARKEVERLQRATDSAWDTLKHGAEKLRKDFATALQRTEEDLREGLEGP